MDIGNISVKVGNLLVVELIRDLAQEKLHLGKRRHFRESGVDEKGSLKVQIEVI